MLVLLGISTIAAALVPPQDRSGGDTTGRARTSTQKGTDTGPDRVPTGQALGAAIEVGGKKTTVVPIRVGDQLSLTISSTRADQVEIPAFGLLKAVAPDAPARFNLLAEREGDYPIRLVDADRVVGRIVVKPKRKAAGQPPA